MAEDGGAGLWVRRGAAGVRGARCAAGAGAAAQVLPGLVPGWSGPRSKTRLTRYLAG